jgi:hypothetical protein
MLWLFAGLIIGILNDLTLRWTVGRLRSGPLSTGVPLVVAGFVFRMGSATALLILASQHSLAPGLLTFAGLWLVRWIAILVTLSPRQT